MMDKQTQIEEMAKDMLDYGMEGYPTFDSVFTETKLREQVFNVFLVYAERLIKKGYRKIPEGSVVLTKEEYDGLKLIASNYSKAVKEVEARTVKEFAEAIWDNATNTDEVGTRWVILQEARKRGVKLDRELKKYGKDRDSRL